MKSSTLAAFVHVGNALIVVTSLAQRPTNPANVLANAVGQDTPPIHHDNAFRSTVIRDQQLALAQVSLLLFLGSIYNASHILRGEPLKQAILLHANLFFVTMSVTQHYQRIDSP